MSPGQLLLMRRQGPGMAPGAGGRLAPPAMGGAPGAAPDIGQELGKLMAQLGEAQGDYVSKVVGNMKRTAAVLIAKLNQSHPEVARHMTRAYTSLDAALTAAKKANEVNQQQSAAGPPLGFSGAAMEGTAPATAGPQVVG